MAFREKSWRMGLLRIFVHDTSRMRYSRDIKGSRKWNNVLVYSREGGVMSERLTVIYGGQRVCAFELMDSAGQYDSDTI